MDPAMPDWRALGQPVAPATAAPAHPEGRPSPVESLLRLPRTTLVGVAIAAVLAVAGLGLALAAPAGGDIALLTDLDGEPGDLPPGRVQTGHPDGRSPEAPDVAVAAPDLVIDVAGAVARPGLVRLPAGSRVGDAITAAGGYAPGADLAAASLELNLAAPLADGTKVLVPTLGTAAVAERPADAPGDPQAPTGRVDLNAASQSELEALPGIGPVTAGRILEARTEAPFGAVEELRSRGLVGDATFGKLRDLVTVGR